jgi:hypothetical protein
MTEVKKDTYKWLQGEKIPTRMRKEVYSYLGGCSTITNDGKRCSKAFNYVDDKGNKLNCEGFCLKNCSKWIDDILDNLPTYAKIEDIEIKVLKVSFNITPYLSYVYLYNVNKWEIRDRDGNISKNKLSTIKKHLCSTLNNSDLIERKNFNVSIYGEIINKLSSEDRDRLNKLNDGDDLLSIVQLQDKDRNRWFTPKWSVSYSPFYDTINMFKNYKITK